MQHKWHIKPQPKEPHYLYLYKSTDDGKLEFNERGSLESDLWKLIAKIKLEVDDHGDI